LNESLCHQSNEKNLALISLIDDGASVVGEEIESEDYLQSLKTLNCEFGQGYNIARALNSDEAESYLWCQLEGI
jgi:EAL domain-containing protein (putative c-di-GMP-specific phosphodiesterase class I)